ncbi:hypothetical protein HDU80_001583 [Chytriomyces hyalinus]|nr:hypothetical protein HDU80_001583 [Chytriomyces hyalinus]
MDPLSSLDASDWLHLGNLALRIELSKRPVSVAAILVLCVVLSLRQCYRSGWMHWVQQLVLRRKKKD